MFLTSSDSFLAGSHPPLSSPSAPREVSTWPSCVRFLLRPSPGPASGPLPGPALRPTPRPWSRATTPCLHPPSQDSPLQHRPQALGRRHPLRLRDAAHAQGPGASQGLPAGGDHRDHRGGEGGVLRGRHVAPQSPPFQLSMLPCQHSLCTFPERSQPAPA